MNKPYIFGKEIDMFTLKKQYPASSDTGSKDKRTKTKKIIAIAAVICISAVSAAISIASSNEAKRAESLNEITAQEMQEALPSSNIFFEEEIHKKKNTGRTKTWSLMSVPLWVCGQIAALLLRPVLGKVLTSIIIAAIFFGIFCLCLKLIFPDKKLKELLTLRNLASYALCTGVFITALNIPKLIDTETSSGNLIMLIAGSVCAIAMVLLCGDKKEKPAAEADML